MSKISVVIITSNEENIIERCIIGAKKIADDIIVVDSYSTDKTKEISLQLGVHFIEQKWLGYSEQKNFGNHKAKNDWILSIDADEIITDEVAHEINLLELKNDFTVYKICRLNNYCTQWIKHGRWYPEWRNRLFNRQHIKWNGDIVHEDLTAVSGKLDSRFSFKKISGDVLHYSMKTKEEHLNKIEKYATLSALKLKANNKKASFIKRYLSPMSRFVTDYFFRLGFLDGKLGFQIAKLSAFETYLKYFKLSKL